jgi:hypothetical protein
MHIASLCASISAGMLALAGCTSRGPEVIPTDRFNYNASIANSMQEQLLLNIVRMRYGEAPFFLDVASVVQQYSRTARADVTGLAIFNGASDGQAGVGFSGTMVETPTITYRPIVGAELVNQLVQPIPPSVVIILMAHGWDAREIMLITVERLNDLRNPLSSGASMMDVKAREDFFTVLSQIAYLQLRAGLRVRAVPKDQGGGYTLRTQPGANETPEITAMRARFREILDIDQNATFTDIVSSPRSARNQIAIETRSVMSILAEISRDIRAPERDIESGRAYPGRGEDSLTLAKIMCADERPSDAYIAVEYRGTWFYVPDTDLQTKRVFALLQMLLAVQTAPERSLAPLITVGAGG